MFDGYIILIKKNVVDQPPSYPHKMVTYHILIYPVPFFYDHKKNGEPPPCLMVKSPYVSQSGPIDSPIFFDG